MSYFKIEWIGKHLGRAPRVVIDAGCYDAKDAIRIKKTYTFCNVYAIEACSRLFKSMLIKKLDTKHGISIHHSAISNIDSPAVVFRSAKTDVCRGASSLFFPSVKLADKGFEFFDEFVPCCTMKTFLEHVGETAIDFLYMDLQGAESLALEGLGQYRPKLIFVEVNALKYYRGAESPKAWLESNGYKIVETTEADELWVYKKGATK